MSAFDTPAPGFHFLVTFELVPQLPADFRFQEVSGLDVEMEMESVKEGGQNRFTHQMPVRARYSDIVLKRGMFFGSGIILWCRQAIENFTFQPVNVLISLLNADHLPLNSWYVINAVPKKWQVSGFNAMENSLVIETLTLSYQYFNMLTPDAVASGVAARAGATAAVTSTVGLNLSI
jgi:phage tail-like protein